MGWDMIDETAWQRNKAVSLTLCWSWDETWLMRMPGKEIQQCHSLPVSPMGWLPGKGIMQFTHCLLVMGWNMMRHPVEELCCHPPTVGHGIDMMRLPGKAEMWCYWCYSPSVCGQRDYLGSTSEHSAPAHSLLDQLCERQLGNMCNEYTSCFSCSKL